MLNTSILVLSLVVPWRELYPDMVPAIPIPIAGWLVFRVTFHMMLHPSFLEYSDFGFIRFFLEDVIVIVGTVSLFFYTCGNVYRAFGFDTHRLLSIFLRASILTSVFVLYQPPFSSGRGMSGLLIGYYVAAVIWATSVFLEHTDILANENS